MEGSIKSYESQTISSENRIKENNSSTMYNTTINSTKETEVEEFNLSESNSNSLSDAEWLEEYGDEIVEISLKLEKLGIVIPQEELANLAENLKYNKKLKENAEINITNLAEWFQNCSVSDRVYSINDVSDIEINTNGLSEEKIIYVQDPEDNTKYFQMTIRDFVGYVSANGNNGIYNECFTEKDDGTLVFDYNKAKTKLNVIDGTADTIDRNMYASISNDFSVYNDKANQLIECYQLKSCCESAISNIVYDYIGKSDKFIEVIGDDGFLNPTPETLNILKELNVDENIIENIDCVTEEQKRMILYLYKEGGENSVRQYINEQNLNDQINQVLGAREANEFLDTLPKDENGNLSVDALTTILTAYEGLGDGVQNYIEGLMNNANFITGSDGEKSVNSYKQLYILKAVQASKILSATYNVSTSIGNMAIPLASSAVLGTLGVSAVATSLISNSLFFTSSLGNSYNEGKLSGLSDGQARLYAILSSSSETTTQMLLGGIPGLSMLYSSNSFIANILSEGAEESVQEIFGTALMSSMTGETIDLSNLTDEALTAGLYGILVAGILGGAEKSFKILIAGESFEISQKDLEKTLQDSDGVITQQQLEEMLFDPATEVTKAMENYGITEAEAMQYIQKIEDAHAAGENITDNKKASILSETLGISEEIATIMIEKNFTKEIATIMVETPEKIFDLVMSGLKQNTTKRFDSNDSRSFEFKMNRALEEYHNKYGNNEKYEVIKNTPEFIEIVENQYINDVIKAKGGEEYREAATDIANKTISAIKGGMEDKIYNENMSFTDVLLNIQENIGATDLYSESYIKEYVEKNILPSCYVNDSGQIIFRAAKIQSRKISRSLFGSLSTEDGKIGGAYCFPWQVMDSILSNPNIFDQKTGECVSAEKVKEATGGVILEEGKEFSIAYIEIPLEKIMLPNGANKNAFLGEFQLTGYTLGHLPEIIVPACNASNIRIEKDNNGSPIKYDSSGNKSNSGDRYKYLVYNSDKEVVLSYFGKIGNDTILNPSSELCDQMVVTVEPRKVKSN